jgi:hypothetical protein
MARSGQRRGSGRDDSQQLQIDWTSRGVEPAAQITETSSLGEPSLPIAGRASIAHDDDRSAQPNICSQRAHRRIIARLPVPEPLRAAVAAGHFGHAERGPVRPSPDEVRAISEAHAEKLIDLLTAIEQAAGSYVSGKKNRLQELFANALAAYAGDFGEHAAKRLEGYAKRQATLKNDQGWCR